MQILIVILAFVIPLFDASALVNEIELPLLSYHINKNQTYKEAPNKIDNNAIFVLNPGLLLGLDTRENTKTQGLSLIAKGGFLQDCANKTAFAIGGGGRYRHFIMNNVSFDINGYLMGANAVSSFAKEETLCVMDTFKGYTCKTYKPDTKREFTILPLVNFGLNYHFKSNKTIGTTLSCIPKNTAIAATSGTDLLFFTVNFGF